MALAHENLYRSDNFSRIDVSTFIGALVENLKGLYAVDRQRISLRTQLDDVGLHLDQAVPIGLIINELASNALKHAFPEGRAGTVLVVIRNHHEGSIELMVSDDGIGMPVATELQDFPTLGLKLVVAMSDQLKAKLQLNRDSGTCIKIIFKRKPL